MYYLYNTKKVKKKKKRIPHVNPECATINLYDSQQVTGTISLRAPLLWGVNANSVLRRQEYLFTLRNCQRKQSALWNLRVFLKTSSKYTRLLGWFPHSSTIWLDYLLVHLTLAGGGPVGIWVRGIERSQEASGDLPACPRDRHSLLTERELVRPGRTDCLEGLSVTIGQHYASEAKDW